MGHYVLGHVSEDDRLPRRAAARRSSSSRTSGARASSGGREPLRDPRARRLGVAAGAPPLPDGRERARPRRRSTPSRARNEHAADVYGLEVIHGVVPDSRRAPRPRPSRSWERSTSRIRTPRPFVRFWLYSHPPLAERLAFAPNYDPGRRGSRRATSARAGAVTPRAVFERIAAWASALPRAARAGSRGGLTTGSGSAERGSDGRGLPDPRRGTSARGRASSTSSPRRTASSASSRSREGAATGFGLPAEAVTAEKRRRIFRTAEAWLRGERREDAAAASTSSSILERRRRPGGRDPARRLPRAAVARGARR